ncbi:MAG TPA: thiamine phosphate synthase [Rhodanobacteraceae bacterium]|nr:thiamine phosphate synthase [Rhodanobacteraceae bacterium]
MFDPLLRRRGPAITLGTGLYAITNGPRADLLEATQAALLGGARVLQYRDKSTDATRRLHEARALAQLCAGFEVPLIINDDVELADASGAAGVHLGEGDVGITVARARLGAEAIIGVSCYDSLQRAREAADAGADYIAFGSFFPSPTKPQARRATTELLREAKAFELTMVAIGGITSENGGPLIQAGADYLAAISAVFGATDIRAAARDFTTLFQTRSP